MLSDNGEELSLQCAHHCEECALIQQRLLDWQFLKGAPCRLTSPQAANMHAFIRDTYPIHPPSPRCTAKISYVGECMRRSVRPAVREQVGVDQGTSMSTPIVAGGAVLVRQYFTDGWYPLRCRGSC